MKPLTVLAGQKWLGDEVFKLLLARGWRVLGVAAPHGDRLRAHAERLGFPVETWSTLDRLLPAHGADLLVAAQVTEKIPATTRHRLAMGCLAWHPSFLPRHRGRSAVEWTVRFRDPIAGGCIYWMDDGMDTGPYAAREAVHVMPGETHKDLWHRALAPLALRLFNQVFERIENGHIDRFDQEEGPETWEPGLRPTCRR